MLFINIVGRSGQDPGRPQGSRQARRGRGRGQGSPRRALCRFHPRHRGHGPGGRRQGPVEGRHLCRDRHGLHRSPGDDERGQQGKAVEILKKAGYIG